MDAFGSGISLSYDLAGRRTLAKTTGGSSQSYTYDALGNIIGLTDGLSHRTEFILDSWGRITGIRKPDGSTEQYTYDYMGNMLSSQDGEGNIVSFGYDLNGNMTTRIDQSGNRELFNGNRTGKQTLSGLTAYHYDATKRLVKVDYPTGSEEYRYDKAGNRTEKLINGVTAERYQYDVRNRLISQDILALREDASAQHREYTYDAQGNMLSDGQRSFIYDAMNRLSQVTTADGQIQKNFYDGEGLRAEMEENGRLVSFLYDGEKVVAETDCDQSVIRYIRGYDLISSDSEKAKTYYHYVSDEMGSITHITNEAGNICNHYEYDAFGDFTVKEETVHNRFGYTVYHRPVWQGS